MAKTDTTILVPDEIVMNQIYYIRRQKVMLDRDLAELYGVETKVLNQAVRRNIARFLTEDFMFELTQEEWGPLRSQIVTLKKRGAHSKYLPLVFGEAGVAMLSSVLKSERAIQVNIRIIQVFIRLRKVLTDNTNVHLEIERIKRKLDNQDKNIEVVFQYLDELNEKVKHPPLLPDREMMGYKLGKGKNSRRI